MTHPRTANHSFLAAAGNRRVEQIKDPSGNVKRQLHRVYNQLGQLTQVLNAANDPVETSDALDEPGITDGYDGNGNRILSEDAFGTVTRQAFDPLNRLKATIQNAAGLDPATTDAAISPRRTGPTPCAIALVLSVPQRAQARVPLSALTPLQRLQTRG